MLNNKDSLFWRLYEKNKGLVLYLIFGGLTTFINIAIYYVANNIYKIGNVPSNIIAWIFAMLFAFVTNKVWVFESKSWRLSILKQEFVSFVSVRLITGVLEVVLMWIGVDLLKYNNMLMKVLVAVIIVISNYFGSKLFIFKKRA